MTLTSSPVRAVTVGIVTHNSASVVGDCLASLPAAFGDIPYEVVVVDNASTDDTTEVVERHAPTASVVELSGNFGYARGVNVAWTAAPADAVLVLNPDVRLAPNSVRALVAALGVPGAGIAVPRTTDGNGRLVHSLRRDPSVGRALGEALLGGRRAGRYPQLGEVVRNPRDYLHPGQPDWAAGAVMLISRACMEAAGPWDTSFFMYSEELEFAWRARSAGYHVRYVPDAVATHLGGQSGAVPELWRLLSYNRVAAFARHHGRLETVAFWAAVVLNELLRSARPRERGATHRAALVALLTPWRGPARRAEQPPPGYVFFSAHDWWYHSHAHSDFQLALRVAERRPVLFVNSMGLRMPRPGRTEMAGRKVLRKLGSVARLVRRPDPERQLWVMTPLFVPAYGSAAVRAINSRLVAWQVAVATRLLRIERSAAIVTLPSAWAVVERLGGWRRTIAYRVDRYASFAEADQDVVAGMERDLVTGADAVAYAGRELLAAEAELTGDRAFFLDHGVDLAHFRRSDDQPAVLPPDVADIPRPRLGYFGTIRDYTVDIPLLERLARELPDAHLVVVGNVVCPVGGLADLPNVHLLGPRPYEEMPAYGSAFDVALMPWLNNEWIRYSNPIKLKEYLALGLPIVSTDFPEARRYASQLRLASTPEELVALVRRTLADGGAGTTRSRREAVSGESWDRRALELMAAAEPEPVPSPAATPAL